jgi:hypothetical protein
MATWEQYRQVLHDHYGVEFPAAIWHLHVFLESIPSKKRVEFYEALGMSPTGPVQLLEVPVAKLKKWKPKPSGLLHWRFYRDVPEFFSCLHGDTDGLHWGLLLDDPSAGFKGASSYYNNDGDLIVEYRSLFDAVLARLDSSIEGIEELAEDDPDETAYYVKQIDLLKEVKPTLIQFMRQEGIPRSDRRPAGLENDTGLSVVAPGQQHSRWTLMDASGRAKTEGAWAKIIAQALAAAAKEEPYSALSVGRSLWYFGGDKYSQQAYELLRTAYEVLEQPTLLHILKVHHSHRQLPNVDLFRK